MVLLGPLLWVALGLLIFGLVATMILLVSRNPDIQEFPMNTLKTAERDVKLKITLTEKGGKYSVLISVSAPEGEIKPILNHSGIPNEEEAHEIFNRMSKVYGL